MTMSQEYAIQGLSCASCAHAVEVALQAVAGVQSAHVNLATEKVVVEADAQVCPLVMQAAVQEAGYNLVLPLVTQNFAVSGLSCASCAANLEVAVGRLAGLASAVVNFATQVLTVTYPLGAIDVEQISQAVEAAGYHAQWQASSLPMLT